MCRNVSKSRRIVSNPTKHSLKKCFASKGFYDILEIEENISIPFIFPGGDSNGFCCFG
jgi:hypothetical protein